jgi:hypothetical protein
MHHDQQQLQSVEFHHTDIREKEPSFKERDKREEKSLQTKTRVKEV